MTFHERFEHLVAPALGAALAAIAVIALLQLIRLVFFMLLACSLDPLEHDPFMPAFGMIMALPIPGIQACDQLVRRIGESGLERQPSLSNLFL